MNDTETITRLMVGLLTVVYMTLEFVSSGKRPLSRSMIPVMAVVVVVTGIWVIFPTFLEVGRFELSYDLRRMGLFVGALAVVLLYLKVRRPDERPALTLLSRFAPSLLGIGLVATTANWLVGIASAVFAVSATFSRVGGSPRGVSSPPEDPPDFQ